MPYKVEYKGAKGTITSYIKRKGRGWVLDQTGSIFKTKGSAIKAKNELNAAHAEFKKIMKRLHGKKFKTIPMRARNIKAR